MMPMHGKTVLVVDDSPTEVRLMTSALQEKGCRVLAATDGEEALHSAEAAHPDLVLLDVVLPKKNGFQVCRQLKSSPGTKDIKVILVSGKAQESDRFWGLKQGADEYLTKPFTSEQLLASITKHV